MTRTHGIIVTFAEKLYNMSRGIYNELSRDREPGTDTLKGYDHKRFSNDALYSKLVRTGAIYYDNMRDLRKKFVRDLDYYMGRQLEDEIVFNGRTMSVRTYMEMKGMAPLSSDIITDKMVTLKGIIRQQYMAPVVKSVDAQEGDFASVFNALLRQNDNNNEKAEHNADQFEKHICMGFIADKVKWAFRNGREDVYVDAVDMFKLAVPVFSRKDLEDIEFIAEAHDMLWSQMLQKFYRRPGDEKKLEEIYTNARSDTPIQGYNDTGMNQTDHLDDFYHPSIVGTYRVIEIWTKEYQTALWCHDRLNATAGFRPLSDRKAIDAENERRKRDNIRKDENGVPLLDADGNQTYYVPQDEVELIEYETKMEEYWYYRYISPNGYLLDEGISPYRVIRDGYSFYYHPYVFLAYPCIQGEIRSFEDRIIDKQRQYNHDNILIDFIIMNSSKGVLAIDTEAVGDDMTWEEMAEQYVKVDGTILYTSKKDGHMPQQIQNQSLPAGLELITQRDRELLTTQSNVQPALQGAAPTAGTSAKRYQMEQQSSATGIADYVSSFNSFVRRVAKKQIWTMQAFYDSHRSVQITGEDLWRYYDRETMGDLEFDLAMTLDVNSAVIREAMKELAFQAYEKDELDFGQMLDSADFGDTARMKRFWMEHKQEKMAIAQQQAAAGAAPTGQSVVSGNRDAGSSQLTRPENDGTHILVGSPGTSA